MGLLDRLTDFGNRLTDSAARAVAFWDARVAKQQARMGLPQRQRKPRGPGVGERVLASTITGGVSWGYWGGWGSDRVEMVLHYKGWSYIAIRARMKEICKDEPNVAFVRPSHKSPTGRQTATLQARYLKTGRAIRPHEDVEMCGPDHPLCRLLKYPNSMDDGADLISELELFRCLTGIAYLWAPPSQWGLFTGNNTPAELWVIPSHWVRTRFGNKRSGRMIDWYEIYPWVGGAGMFKLPPHEVITFRDKSPILKVDGWSPQTAGAEWIDVAESVNYARYFMMKNGCFPVGDLELDPRYSDTTDEELDRVMAKFYGRYQGEPNFGRPIIHPPGSKYTPLKISPVEMDFLKTHEQLRDDVLALWSVPKAIAGIQDAGSEVAMYGPLTQFHRDCITPQRASYGRVLTRQLASRWDDSLRVWWDDSSPDSPQQRNADITAGLTHGFMTLNEARSRMGLEARPEPIADEPLVEPGRVPLSQLGLDPSIMAKANMQAPTVPALPTPTRKPAAPPGDGQPGPPREEGTKPGAMETGPFLASTRALPNGNGHANGMVHKDEPAQRYAVLRERFGEPAARALLEVAAGVVSNEGAARLLADLRPDPQLAEIKKQLAVLARAVDRPQSAPDPALKEVVAAVEELTALLTRQGPAVMPPPVVNIFHDKPLTFEYDHIRDPETGLILKTVKKAVPVPTETS